MKRLQASFSYFTLRISSNLILRHSDYAPSSHPKAILCFGSLSLHPPQRLLAQARQLYCSLPKPELPVSLNLRISHYTKDSSCPFDVLSTLPTRNPNATISQEIPPPKELAPAPRIPPTHHPLPLPSLPTNLSGFYLKYPKQYLFAPEQQRPPLCSWNCSIGVGCRVLLGGGSFKTLPTCLSRVEGMFSLVTSLIPSSHSGILRERGEEKNSCCRDWERLRRWMHAAPRHSVQSYSRQTALWLDECFANHQGTANMGTKHLCIVFVTRPDPLRTRKSQVLDAVSWTLASLSEQQTAPKKAILKRPRRRDGAAPGSIAGSVCSAGQVSCPCNSFTPAWLTKWRAVCDYTFGKDMSQQRTYCKCNKRQKAEPTF